MLNWKSKGQKDEDHTACNYDKNGEWLKDDSVTANKRDAGTNSLFHLKNGKGYSIIVKGDDSNCPKHALDCDSWDSENGACDADGKPLKEFPDHVDKLGKQRKYWKT